VNNRRSHLFGIAVLSICLTGCSAARLGTVPSTLGSANVARPMATASNLYVADLSAVTVYAPNSNDVLRTYSHLSPTAMAFDATGNLYVANAPVGQNGNVTVFRAGTTSVLYTITTGVSNPKALAFDSKGNLYVANSYFAVKVYPPHGTLPKSSLHVFFPTAMDFDSTGTLYVATAPSPYGHGKSQVSVFAADLKQLRVIVNGLNNPTALALSTVNNLFVANYGGNNVTVYAPGKSSVFRTISQGVKGPYSLMFDPSGNLYVANTAADTLTEYAPGSSTVLRTIRQGIAHPDALALTGSTLYVANSKSITVYPPGKSVPSQTITKGVQSPIALGIGP
jgi:sugar lactone lactonase YvrE